MANNEEYVKPPKRTKKNSMSDENQNHISAVSGHLKNNYAHLKPGYWKRKLPQLIIVFPIVNGFYHYIFHGPLSIVALILAIVSAYLYPFSLFWYKQTFIFAFFQNIYFIGSFTSIIVKMLLVIVGGMVFAGVLAPITGLLELRKCKRDNLIIGEEKDFA